MRTSDPVPGTAPLDYAAPPPPPLRVIEWVTLIGHLMGWAAALMMLWWVSTYIVPKIEQTAADYKLRLPLPTVVVTHVAAEARDGGFFILLVPLAIGHAVFAALWHRRAGRGQRRAYRLLLFLVVAAVALFVILGLFLPMVGLINSLSGGAGGRK